MACHTCMEMERERDNARGELGRARFRADNDIRALEAKVKAAHEHNIGLAQSQAAMALAVDHLRADRDRLAGEVERLRAEQPTREDMDDISEAGRLMASAAKKIMGPSAEVARLNSELAAAREDAERLDYLESEWQFEQLAIDNKRRMPKSLFRANRPITRAAIDAARRAGEGEK